MVENQYEDEDDYSIALGAGPRGGVYFFSLSGYQYSYRAKGCQTLALYCTHSKCKGALALKGGNKRPHSHIANKFVAKQCRLRAAIAHYLLDKRKLTDDQNLPDQLKKWVQTNSFDDHAQELVRAFVDELLPENTTKSKRNRKLWEATLDKIARMKMALKDFEMARNRDFRTSVNRSNDYLDLLHHRERSKEIDRKSRTNINSFINVGPRQRPASSFMTSTPVHASKSSMDNEMFSNSRDSSSHDSNATVSANLPESGLLVDNEMFSHSRDSSSYSHDSDATVQLNLPKTKRLKRSEVKSGEEMERVRNWRDLSSIHSQSETQQSHDLQRSRLNRESISRQLFPLEESSSS